MLVNEEPVAALTYHVSSDEPLLVLGADGLDESEDGSWGELEILLGVARATAAALGLFDDHLNWDTDCDECAAVADLHGFSDRYPEDRAGARYQLEARFDD